MSHSIIPNAKESQALGFTRQDFDVNARPGLIILPRTHAVCDEFMKCPELLEFFLAQAIK